ncbi:hypothetical protein [Bacillus sp. JJ1562]|uniref:hypothetical protein n=1 Tax=Bacillus sp. JJ1562 TaxID=3122960 RepID=UPI003002E096
MSEINENLTLSDEQLLEMLLNPGIVTKVMVTIATMENVEEIVERIGHEKIVRYICEVIAKGDEE